MFAARTLCNRVSVLSSQHVIALQRTLSSTAASAAKAAPKSGTSSADVPPTSVPKRPNPPSTQSPNSPDTTTSTSFTSPLATNQPDRPTISAFQTRALPEYDVFIVGGGVTGSALLYQLANFTDVRRIGLVDRRHDFGTVSSGASNNSQTIHCGDIETNYSYDKAAMVKKQADMIRNYGTKLPEEIQNQTIYKMQKMVLGVGEEECAEMETRFNNLRSLFPRMEFMNKTKLRTIEPNVVRISNHRDRRDLVSAIVIRNEHSAVNFHNLVNSFIGQSLEAAANDPAKTIEVQKNTEVKNIVQNDDETYTVYTTRGTVKARFVVVSCCGYSLLFAQKLGYGLKFGCFPVAGSFYFTKSPVLNGKVYTVQNPGLPFAAVHGDPDVHAAGMTRFGPTALPVPLLERYNMASFKDFISVSNFDLKTITIILRMFRDPIMIAFALRNLVYELPYFGVRKFLEAAKKIIPGMTQDDLVFATGYGGLRPQMIDKKKMALMMGETKIMGHNIIFNVTPSPGGTTCLGNGETDLRTVCNALSANIDEAKFRKTLLEGLYPVD